MRSVSLSVARTHNPDDRSPISTKRDTAWFFDPADPHFHGLRCTHQPSPWIGDWAWFVVTPLVDGDGEAFYQPKVY